MANAAAPVGHHIMQERREMTWCYIFWTPPQLMPSDSNSLMEPSCFLQQAAEVKNYSGGKDELTLQRMAPSEPQGSKIQGRTKHTEQSHQQHGAVPGSAALLWASFTQHQFFQYNLPQGQWLSHHTVKRNKQACSLETNLHPAGEYEWMSIHILWRFLSAYHQNYR